MAHPDPTDFQNMLRDLGFDLLMGLDLLDMMGVTRPILLAITQDQAKELVNHCLKLLLTDLLTPDDSLGIPEWWRLNITSFRQLRQLVIGNWPNGERKEWQDIQRIFIRSWTRKDPDWNPHGLDFTWMRQTHQNDPLVPSQPKQARQTQQASQAHPARRQKKNWPIGKTGLAAAHEIRFERLKQLDKDDEAVAVDTEKAHQSMNHWPGRNNTPGPSDGEIEYPSSEGSSEGDDADASIYDGMSDPAIKGQISMSTTGLRQRPQPDLKGMLRRSQASLASPSRSLPTPDLEVNRKRKRSTLNRSHSFVPELSIAEPVQPIVLPAQRAFKRNKQSNHRQKTPEDFFADFEIDNDTYSVDDVNDEASPNAAQDSDVKSYYHVRTTHAVDDGVQYGVEEDPVQGPEVGNGEEENGDEAEESGAGSKTVPEVLHSMVGTRLSMTEQQYSHAVKKAYRLGCVAGSRLGYVAGNRAAWNSMSEALKLAIDRGIATTTAPKDLNVKYRPNGTLDSITPVIDEDAVGSGAEGNE